MALKIQEDLNKGVIVDDTTKKKTLKEDKEKDEEKQEDK